MKTKTKFQIASLLIVCILSSGLLIQSQLFSQSVNSVKSIAVNKVSSAIPNVDDIAPKPLFTAQPYLDAGEDASICKEVGIYGLSGSNTFAGKTLWVTSGDGQFSDPTSLNSLYKPGKYDNSSGEVTLYLYLLNPSPILSEPPIYDAMVLSLGNCIEIDDVDEF